MHQLLDLSRLESGTVPFDRIDFAIHGVLDDVLRTAQRFAGGGIQADDLRRAVNLNMTDRANAAPGDGRRTRRILKPHHRHHARCVRPWDSSAPRGTGNWVRRFSDVSVREHWSTCWRPPQRGGPPTASTAGGSASSSYTVNSAYLNAK